MNPLLCVQAWRTYYQYHSDYVSAEVKLKEAEKQKSTGKKLERLLEKVRPKPLLGSLRSCLFVFFWDFSLFFVDVLQRQSKFKDIYLKCSKARNDYLLNLAAANASMNKYYLQDISTLIDVSASVCHA